MSALRRWGKIEWDNPNFFIVLIFMVILYLIYVIEFMIMLSPSFKTPCLIVFHVIYVLLVWTFIQVTFTEPGVVPPYWSLLNEEMTASERKYCLVCHDFKPERCHHCSHCKKCILNMDHHCPWVNNCIGFYNKKYFLLFLLYNILNFAFTAPQQGYLIFLQFHPIIHGTQPFSLHFIIRLLGFLIGVILFFVLTIFCIFHLKMILVNTTTLESLIKERKKHLAQHKSKQIIKSQTEENNPYDMGSYQNFTQVFGNNPWYWLVPIQNDYQQPLTGLTWPQSQKLQSLNFDQMTRNADQPNQSAVKTYVFRKL